MNSKVLLFKPREEYTVDQNMSAFIDFAKNELILWGDNLDWNSLVWDITGHFEFRGRNEKVHIIWANLETCGKNIKKHERVAIKEPLLSFAKAYIRYTQSLKKKRVIDALISAFRILEVVLVDQVKIADIKYISPNVLNSACDIVKKRYTRGDTVLNAINKVYNDICEFKLSYMPLPWKKPVVKIENIYKVSKKNQEYIRSKCPTDASLRALAKIFCESEHDVDKLVSSIVVIMLSQPCRIAEVLTMPYNCEVENMNGLGTFGLRWRPAKGGDLCVKQILDSWVDLVKQAIVNIKEITSGARKIALWYENNPNKMYIPEEYEFLRDSAYIDTRDVRGLLSLTNSGVQYFRNMHSIDIYSKKTANLPTMHHTSKAVLRSDLEKAVCSYLPQNFPYVDLAIKQKYSESLFVVTNNFFNLNTTKSFSKVMFSPVIFSDINISLGGNKQMSSVFERNGFFEPNGSKIKFSTHSPRHWQNSIANANHVPDILISLWSGRKNVNQNVAYYHTTDEEYIEKVEDFMGDLSFIPSHSGVELGNNTNVYDPVNAINNVLKESLGSSHLTEIGFCVHDFAASPCRKILDHTTCSEHIYLKGDPRNDLLRSFLADEQRALKIVETESKNEAIYGVDVWYTFRSQRVRLLQNIVNIFDDDSIPGGSFFRLVINNEYNPIRIAIYNKTNNLLGMDKQDFNLEFIKEIELV